MSGLQATKADLTRIVNSDHHDPFEVLGMHPIWEDGHQNIVLRCFRPDAATVHVLDANTSQSVSELTRQHPDGFFESVIADRDAPFAYRLRISNHHGESYDISDPYCFGPVLTDFDLHLVGEGSHQNLFDRLGATCIEHEGQSGVLFSVWAPASRRVSVVGSFNGWDGRYHPMRARGTSGIWELFIPEITEGDLYKFETRSEAGDLQIKTDPFAKRMELRPQTASIVHRIRDDNWTDASWIEQRSNSHSVEEPVSIYELHPGSWRRVPEEGNRPLSYVELADQLVPYVRDLGYTHIELMPILEHPLDQSWGYQVLGYYAPTSRFGTPDEFQHFVDTCHANNIGVILDWVPAHFPKDSEGLARFDGTALFEHEDPRQGAHPDWGTLIFNYGRTEVRNFLVNNALYWIEKYHIDGLRVDAVASMLYLDYSREEGEWVPNRFGGRENLDAVTFMQELNHKVYERFPGVLMVAEESTAWPGVSRPTYLGGLGFGFKWNMGWMHDTLDYMANEPVHRKYHHDKLTFGLVYAFHENFILAISHDEVVHGKGSLIDRMPGDAWQKFANLRAYFGYMFGHPGKKLLFMGCEFGQWQEWDAESSLDWHLTEHDDHRGLQSLVRDLNRLYRSEPALHELDAKDGGFDWIDFSDHDQSVVAFERKGKDTSERILFVCNFTPVLREHYRLGVPTPGTYRELLNTDAQIYSGGNHGNLGSVQTSPTESHGRPQSIDITLPPLATVAFKLDG
jgi:1,4-alpha-glucan branching enzyme